MAQNDFSILLKTILDNSSINTELDKVQKIVQKYHLELTPELETKSLQNRFKSVCNEMANDFNKAFGTSVTGNDIFSVYTNKAKQLELQAKADARALEQLKTSASKVRYDIDVGDSLTKIESLKAQFIKLGDSEQVAEQKISGLRTILSSINGISDDQNLVNTYDKLGKEIDKVNNSAKQMRTSMASNGSFSAPLEKVDATVVRLNEQLRKNSAYSKSAKAEIKGWLAELAKGNVSEARLKEINSQAKQLHANMASLNKIGFSFVDKLKNGLAKFGDWFGISTIVMSGVHALGELKDAAFELDGVITDLDMATDLNKEQIKELIGTYSDLGDELNATVTDITTSATEWLKQGKSIADTETLVKDSMILSKVGKLDSAESTKYLTSAMKGYNVEVENTLGIVDKLSAVDMASATDVGGLAEGMSEVANSANLAGISMDKLLGYLATVGEVTQESMPSVGNSFNAIFARMGNIKLSRLKDYQNNGEDLSNVETVLRGEGVVLRDSTNSFRNFGEVIDEVAGNWTNYSEVSQRAIASAFAGTYHMEDFLVLMQNYDTAIKYTETSLNSTGTAMEKFNDWQDGMKAHLEQNKNAFIGLSETVMNTDFLKGAVDTGTGFLNVLTVIIDKVGILPTLLTSVGAGLSLKNVGVA